MFSNNPQIFFIHIDAHADLSIPSRGSIEDWNDKDQLYDILSEEGGIAEFIIPLFTQDMLRQVIWVTPTYLYQENREYQQQLPLGYRCFHLSDSNSPKVDWATSYYLDDDSFQPSSNNSNNNPSYDIRLLTCTTEDPGIFYDPESCLFLCQQSAATPSKAVAEGEGEWILDICLDYFSCNNPFLSQLNHLLESCESLSMSNEEVLRLLRSLYLNLPYRITVCDRDDIDGSEVLRIKTECRRLLFDVLHSANDVRREEVEKNFLALFSVTSEPVIEDIRHFIGISKHLSKEVKDFIYERGYLLLLPHHLVTSDVEIDEAVERLATFLRHHVIPQMRRKPPLCITIATSAMDEYTVAGQTDVILDKVLGMVNELVGDLVKDSSDVEEKDPLSQWKSRDLSHIRIHDIRHEPIEAAYLIRFPRKNKASINIVQDVVREGKKMKRDKTFY